MQDTLLQRLKELEPLCVLRLLVRKLWLIAMAALTAAMAAAVVLTAVVTTSYSTSVTFAVISRAYGSSGYASIAVAQEVAQVYSQLLSGSYMNETIREDVGDVSGSISAAQLGETNLIQVTVTSDSPRDALLIIQSLIANQEEISEYVSSTAVLNPIDSLNIGVTTSARRDISKISLLAALGGAAVMALLLVAVSIAEMTVQTRSGAKHNLDGRLLTAVPHEARPNRRKNRKPAQREVLITKPLISFGFTEAINRVAAICENARMQERRVLLFTSALESEGKSTIAANTALALAKKGSRVLLMDLDLRRPVQHTILNETVSAQQELGTLLSGHLTPAQILERAISRPGTELDLLLASRPAPASVRQLGGPVVEQLLDLARQRYDYVIIDTPPLSYFADGQRLADLADASVLVVRQDVAPVPLINDAIDDLRAGKSEFLGYLLNDMQHLLGGSSEYGYQYGSRNYGHYGAYGRHGKYGGSGGMYGKYAKKDDKTHS